MGNARLVPGDKRIAVHVVEGHPLITHTLRSILGRAFPRITFHNNVPASLPRSASLVLLVDAGTLAMPVAELLRTVRRNHPKARVIVLAECCAPCSGASLIDLLFLGAAGVVAYDRAEEELCDAIRSVARGHVWMATGAVDQFDRQKRLLANGKRNASLRGLTGLNGLTGREAAIMSLLERGFCNKEIASMAGISVPTVKFHLHNIFAKAGVHERFLAIDWAKRNAAPQPASACQ